MTRQQAVDVSDVSEGETDNKVGQKVLNNWDNSAKWLPEGFSDDAKVESTELVVCERKIKRETIASEHTENLELTQREYRTKKNNLYGAKEYRDRDYDVPQGGEGTLVYQVPNTHRESNCSGCSGSGRLPCQNCGSSGSVHCPSCGGNGRQETERKCPRCRGSGYFRKDMDIQCSQCAGKGYEIIDEKCSQCRGTGNVSCSKCSGSGYVTCNTCEGEGLTHKLEVLYRKCKKKRTVTHTTNGVPEKFIKDAKGQHINTKKGSTSSRRPRHEIEKRSIDVLKVDYSYEDQPLLSDGGEEKQYTVYYVEGQFKKGDYPKSQTRKLLPIVGGVALILLAIVIVVFVL